MGFLFKTVVAAISIYAINDYLRRNPDFLKRAVETGVQIVNNALTQVAEQAAKQQREGSIQ